nr:immunoglobulin heavy chain junction region [Macaca mulatta]
YTRGNVW